MKNSLYLLLKKALSCSGRKPGFGLVESLVAIAILGISLTAFITDLSAGSIAVNSHSEQVVAQGLAPDPDGSNKSCTL
jgi:prepilin-type N-terminal cleavage/methylation domain-containing protein